MRNHVLLSALALGLLFSCSKNNRDEGKTEITTWKDGKRGAISITWDDASINQFRKAMPVMDALDIKATFFINTANIADSEIPAKHLGKPVADIIKETASVPTDKSNLFERASALRFIDMPGAVDAHNSAGSLYEDEKFDEAFKVVDDAYAKVRKLKAKPTETAGGVSSERITWDEVRKFAANGHEFASHTISHPRLSVLDEKNMLYELEKSKEEIAKQLGPEHTFSAECPFGTENQRVMDYALKIYPALRNRMPEPFLAEINRGNNDVPGMFHKPYIQWQRGPVTRTTMATMNSWVDTLLVRDNVWLVLTFHGVDGIGWEPKPHEDHAEYFQYMKDHSDELWVATFRDVTKYMRERISAKINTARNSDHLVVNLSHSLDRDIYNLPLTLRTYVPDGWKKVKVSQGKASSELTVSGDENGSFVQYDAIPNGDIIALSQI